MSKFPMGDWVYNSYKKSEKRKLMKSISRLLKEIKIQIEEMEWNKKRFRLLIKLEKDYDKLNEYLINGTKKGVGG